MSHTIDLGYVIGPKGEQGEQGVQGVQGVQGERGEQGIPGVPGTANITDDILSTKHTIATNNGNPYIAPNDDISAKRYINLHGDSFGTCDTSRSDINKKVTLDNFILVEGARISVRFTDDSDVNPSGGNLSLNVNETGEKTIVMGTSNKDVVTYIKSNEFCNNIIKEFVYDGEYWVLLNDFQGDIDALNNYFNEIGNVLGKTDISAIGDGTVTGGLDSLNNNLSKQNKTWRKILDCVSTHNVTHTFESIADCSEVMFLIENDNYVNTGFSVVIPKDAYDKTSKRIQCMHTLSNASYVGYDVETRNDTSMTFTNSISSALATVYVR